VFAGPLENDVLPESLNTVAELFQRAGYRTACLSRNSYLSSETGFDRGFDRIEWITADRFLQAVGLRTAIKYFANLRCHSVGFTTDTAKHSTPYIMNDVAKRWVRGLSKEQPFFFYLHYNEPHSPFYPPLPFLNKYTDELNRSPEEAAEIAMDIHHNMDEYVANGIPEEKLAVLHAMYDAEIAYTDRAIGRLVRFIQESSLADTVVVITSDHGEMLGEKDLLSHHICVDDAVAHVPLVIHNFDAIDHHRNELLQQIDVMTTLLAEAGETHEQLQGLDLRDETRQSAFIQENATDFDRFLKFTPDFDVSSYHGPVQSAIRTKEFKFVKSDSHSDLYRLPDEETDVSAEFPDERSQLETKLDDWLHNEAQPIERGIRREYSEQMQQQLRELGYLS